MKVAITGVGLWTPHCRSAAAWAAGERSAQEQKPVGIAYDKRNRRRVSALGRAIGDAVEEAMLEAALDPVTTPVIVGSSIGEASTMIGLLDQMWRTKEPMSPAAFSVSVHNAASGMLSISKKNVGFTTSIAADHDTPAAGLIEGIGLVATTGAPVAVVCADEASPRSLLRRAARHWDMLAAAVVLAPADAGRGRATLSLPAVGLAATAGGEVDDTLIANPQVGLLDLVVAVLGGEDRAVALDRGAGRGHGVTLTFGAGR